MKRIFLLFLFLLIIPTVLLAVKQCPSCDYRVKSSTAVCPKCLKKIDWPWYPPAGRKNRIVIREGKDAFIRHLNSQNRAYKSNRNSGRDLSGQIGSWGFLTGLRYLVSFDVMKGFAAAGINPETFVLKKATLRLVVAEKQIKQQVPVRVYPLTKPFTEGTGRFQVRENQFDGCTWHTAGPFLHWTNPGGDYQATVSSTGVLGYKNDPVAIIDVTEIYKRKFEHYKISGEWNDYGLIIMRDAKVARNCTFLTIYSLESGPFAEKMLSPQLFLE
ncbi:MAG: hypothetical protein ACQETH_11395 [Candidatus Rifleibacteriota bacterium]